MVRTREIYNLLLYPFHRAAIMRKPYVPLIVLLLTLAYIAILLQDVLFSGAVDSYERRFFDAIGFHGNMKLLVLVPAGLGAFYYSSRFKQARSTMAPRWLVMGGICVIALGAGVIVWLFMA